MKADQRTVTALLAAALLAVGAMLALVLWGGRGSVGRSAESPGWRGERSPPQLAPLDAREGVSRRGAGQSPEDATSSPVPSSLIRVVRADGPRIAGARVSLYAGQGSSPLGATDAQGELALDRSLPSQGLVRAAVPGAWSESVCLETQRESTVVIRVLPEGTIRGAVLKPDGTRASEGLTVLAWPSALRAPDRKLTLSSWLGDSHRLATSTGSDGSFEFSTLDPRTRYDLACGGHGLLTPRPTKLVLPDGGFVELRLSRLHGSMTRIMELGRRELAESSSLAAGFAVTLRLDKEDPKVRKVPEFLVFLSGVVPPAMDLPPFSSLMFYGVDDERRSVGPIELQASIPGYEPLRHRFHAWPVLDGGMLHEELVELTPIANARGDLEVVFEGSRVADEWADTRLDSIAVVHLRHAHGHHMEFAMSGFSPGESVIRAIPEGDWAARVSSRTSSFLWPPADEPPLHVRVGGTPAASISVSTAGLGSIHALIEDDQGIAYTGPAAVVLVPVGPVDHADTSERLREINFIRAPYCIGGLSPGEYRLAIRFPLAQSSAFEGQGSVRICAGERRDVRFLMAPDGLGHGVANGAGR